MPVKLKKEVTFERNSYERVKNKLERFTRRYGYLTNKVKYNLKRIKDNNDAIADLKATNRGLHEATLDLRTEAKDLKVKIVSLTDAKRTYDRVYTSAKSRTTLKAKINSKFNIDNYMDQFRA